jgi:hypothetical protein
MWRWQVLPEGRRLLQSQPQALLWQDGRML